MWKGMCMCARVCAYIHSMLVLSLCCTFAVYFVFRILISIDCIHLNGKIVNGLHIYSAFLTYGQSNRVLQFVPHTHIHTQSYADDGRVHRARQQPACREQLG